MRILFVIEHFYPYTGGAESLFLGLAKALATNGNEVTVVTTRHNSALAVEEIFEGIRIFRVSCKSRFGFTFFSIPAVIRFAKKADLIHTASYNAAIRAFIAGQICRKKVVITFHEVLGNLWFHLPFKSKFSLTLFYLFEWFTLKLPFTKFIAVSDFTRQSLLAAGVPKKKVIRIYNGLDYTALTKFHHQLPKEFTFCFFGRLGISKGIDLLLEATKEFTAKYPAAKLKLIIPTYPVNVFNKVTRMIDSLHVRPNIILLHDLGKDELMRELTNSSCVVIPSLSEGFCFAAAEAVALRIPVISSGRGALKEVVGGKHIHLNNLTVEDMVKTLERAYKDNYDNSKPKLFELNTHVQSHQFLYDGLMKSNNSGLRK